MNSWKDLADLMFPDVHETIEDLLQKFPKRDNELCSRFAPSPTGYLHIWGVFSAFVAYKFVSQSNGTFILRVEDTDQKRQIEWWIDMILDSMKTFWINIDEWALGEDNTSVWNYGPYIQSQRKYFYRVFAKSLVEKGMAYPCWMTEDEIDSVRNQQTLSKTIPGIYGNYSLYRNKEVDELIQKVKDESDYILRFRSHGDTQKKIIFDDVLRGKVNMLDNYNDIVLIKSDGLPTYHLAHIVDDTLMRVSHVIRAEEWLTSVPLHLQLFEAFWLSAPKYCHLAQILKNDEETGKKRKLSKRKDPEADVNYFFERGYAVHGILDYLYTIMDSWFEEWQKNNPEKSFLDCQLVLENMNKSGAIFDIQKMQSVNNAYLSRISTDQLFDEALVWAKEYNTNLAELMTSNSEYAKAALNIERHTEKDPKRFTTFQDIETQLKFFFDEEWNKLYNDKPELPSYMTKEILENFVSEYCSEVDLSGDVQSWFGQLKEIGKKYGFAGNNAEFKEWWYIWKIGDLAMFLRCQLCCSNRTPDLFSVMQVLGKERIEERLKKL